MDIASIGATQLIKGLLDKAKKSFGNKIDIFFAEQSTANLNDFICNVEYVKTLWQPEKKVKISDFYVPPKLLIDKDKKLVNSIDDLPKKQFLIIKGLAGQGKSIFLRHLCVEEMKRGEFIPIFVSLNRINSKSTFDELIVSISSEMGLIFKDGLNGDLFDYFAKSGKLLFLLDGFDEINPEFSLDTINRIEHIAKKYFNLNIIISCRPNSEILKSNLFDICEISPLKKEDQMQLIRKFSEGDLQFKMLEEAINSKPNVRGVLTTPLLIIILVITYKANNEIPETLSLFYENTFFVLLTRHDQSKPGYVRKRKSQLNDFEFLDCFNIISLLSLKENKSLFSQSEFYNFSKKALEKAQKDQGKAGGLIDDIVQITNLIIKEDLNYQFIHKTIQEFHAAKFIADSPEKNASQFYSSLENKGYGFARRDRGWDQCLYFLEEIDRYRYYKFFTVPSFSKAFDVDKENPPNKIPNFSKGKFSSLIKSQTITFRKENDVWNSNACTFDVLRNSGWAMEMYVQQTIILESMQAFKSIMKVTDQIVKSHSKQKDETLKQVEFSALECITKLNLWDPFLELINKNSRLKGLYNKFLSMRDYVKHEEISRSELLDFEV